VVDFALEDIFEVFAELFLFAFEAGHQREPVVDFFAEVFGHDGLDGDDAVEGADAGLGDLFAHELGAGGAVLAGEADDFVDGCVAAVAEVSFVEAETVEDDVGGAGVETRHEVPRVAALVAAVAEVAAQNHGRDVGELREHEFDDGAGIEFGAVVVEKAEVALEERADVLIADGLGGVAALL
jgi:hypothetical protein